MTGNPATKEPKLIRSLVLPFPIRPRFCAQVIVPIDISKHEADRLCAFVMALAQV